jgi:TonB-dependent receptor
MRKTLQLILVIVVSTLFGQMQVSAQVLKGSIAGRVTDSSGAVLQGAQVELQPKTQSVVTNQHGEFTILSLEPGNYTVTVSYVGFTAFSKDVAVSTGQSARIDAILGAATKTEEVVVYAEREHGEVEAINRTRASDNILQVLPVEVITSLPNTNIADALGRMPSVTLERDEGEGKYVQIRGLEPRLSNVTVNGVNVPSPEAGVRQIKLDTIPANLVDSVEINKTLSANQDGDAIGGSVNLVTKTAEKKPTLYLNGIGGYTPIVGGRSLTEMDGTIGKRFGARKKLGILIGSSYDWNGRGIDDVEPVPTAIQCDPGPTGCVNPSPNAPYFPTYSTQDIREYRYYRTRYGLAGSIDYKLGDISGLYIRGIYSHFNNFGDRWVYSPTTNSTTDASGNPLTSGWLTPGLTDNNGSISFNAQIRRPVDVIGSVEAGGKHVWAKWLLAYNVSLSRSSEEDHGYSSSSFNGPTGQQFAISTQNPLRPKFIPQSGFPSVYDPSQYTLANIDVSTNYSPEVNLQGGFSAARTYMIGRHFGTFEFGAKVRNAHKFEDAFDPTYNTTNNVPALTSFLGSFTNPNYYDKSYTLGPTADYNKIRSYFNANVNDQNSFMLDDFGTALNTDGSNYDLVERVTAGYFMNTIDFGRVRIQTGLRFEATHEGLLGNKVTDPVPPATLPNVTPLGVDSSYLDPLPSVQVRFRLPHDAAIRAVYGRGIARPNFADLPPTFNTQNNPGNEVDVGNPFLKPTHANNYDLLYEQYLKPLGLIQAGFFYKQLSNPIYQTSTLIDAQVVQQNQLYPLGGFLGQKLVQQVNGSSAYVYGFELAYQQHLTFLPGALKHFGISANYGYTASKANNVPGRTDNPSLQRQAPNTWNISPTFDRGRLSARLGVSHNDANIFSYGYQDGAPLGKKGPLGDTYLYAHTQIDAQGSFRMYRGLELVVSGLNLSNEVFGFYNGSAIFPIQREYYKPSYSFGLRYTLSNEPK